MKKNKEKWITIYKDGSPVGKRKFHMDYSYMNHMVLEDEVTLYERP